MVTSPSHASPLAFGGLVLGKLCLSFQRHVPKAVLAASLSPQTLLTASLSGLQQREACSLLRGVHEEIVDVAFPRGAKAQDIFLIARCPIRQQKASHMCCRVSAWLALAVIRAWNQWWVADALPSVSQFLIQ